jgi:hypothetical protein
MTCQVCMTAFHRGSAWGSRSDDPPEPCECGHMISGLDAREIGEDGLIELMNEYAREREYAAADAADDAADVAYDISREDR